MDLIVANALWIPPGGTGGPNLGGHRLPASEIYLRNSHCCLASVRRFHPEAILMLFHSGSIPHVLEHKFLELGVRLQPLEPQRFAVPDSYPWKGGYYKLDAMEWLIQYGKRFLLLDTDTVVVAPLTDLMAEGERILLYETGHRMSHRSRSIINAFGTLIDGRDHRVSHRGGEGLWIPPNHATSWLQACDSVFQVLKNHWDFFHQDNPDQGDELILSFAAEACATVVGPLNPYLRRYWTMKGCVNLSTQYNHDPVDIWHVPWEKTTGMMDLYEHLERKGVWPEEGDLIRMLHLEQGWASGLFWELRKLKRALARGRR